MTMTRDQIETLVADLLADGLTAVRADLESLLARQIADKAVPPFVPPPPWTEGRHGAGHVVRHRNGLFMARHDTDTEPADAAWLPLLVGLAGFNIEWVDDRTLVIRCELSDGHAIERSHEFAVPLVRGEWEADQDYRPGDRVLFVAVDSLGHVRGEYQALSANRGVQPTEKATWLKVRGTREKALDLLLNRDGVMSANGRAIGSIKPMVADLLAGLVREHANGGSDGR